MGGCSRAEPFPGTAANLLILFAVILLAAVPTLTIIIVFAQEEPIQPADREGVAVNNTELYSNSTGETPASKR